MRPKIKRISRKIDDVTKITNRNWVVFNEVDAPETYIFRNNNDLLISRKGIVEKGRWDYIDQETILIESTSGNYLFRYGFFDQNIFALKLDSSNEFAILLEEKFQNKHNFKTIDQLNHYLNNFYLQHDAVVSKTELNQINSDEDTQSGIITILWILAVMFFILIILM